MGLLVALEGIDGSGKGTQAHLLSDLLTNAGVSTCIFRFPAYEETFFGREVGKYLNGYYGSLEDVHPKFAAMLYAADRWEKRNDLVKHLRTHHVVICDRYVGSNLAHQAARMPSNEHEAMISWIESLEYSVYRLPKPHMTILLDMPVEYSTRLVKEKMKRSYTEKVEDIHERDIKYMLDVQNLYKKLATAKGWRVVPCIERDNLRSSRSVSIELFELIMNALRNRPALVRSHGHVRTT